MDQFELIHVWDHKRSVAIKHNNHIFKFLHVKHSVDDLKLVLKILKHKTKAKDALMMALNSSYAACHRNFTSLCNLFVLLRCMCVNTVYKTVVFVSLDCLFVPN